jgi:superfamily II DNA or RNA helicase
VKATLRPYQERLVEGTFAALASSPSTLAVMATGLGKTVCFSAVAERWRQGRVLVLAHREELIFQAAEKIADATGADPGIEMASERVDRGSRCKVVVASVPTLTKPKRLRKFDPRDFGLVVVDEAHHATAASYLRILDYFRDGLPAAEEGPPVPGNPDSRRLGLTATANRTDGSALGQVFETVAFDYGIAPAVEDGWLVPVRQQVVKVEGLDFSKARTTAGDFNEADLEAIVSQEEILHRVAAPTVELAAGLPTLVFCVTVKHAERMSEILNRYKDGSAAWVCGATDKDTRRETLARFRAGKVQFLCNVGVLLEGFDAPRCACVAMARPTKSLLLYTQTLGRGTRPLPGLLDPLGEAEPAARRAAIAASGKPSLLVLDYAGNAGRHRIVTSADLLGGKYEPAVRDYARRTLLEEGRAVAVADALERAKDEVDFLAEEREREEKAAREREARRHVTARAEYHAYGVSPFGGAASSTPGTAAAPRRVPPSDGQVRHLCWLGVPEITARSYSRAQAHVVISRLRRERGLPEKS